MAKIIVLGSGGWGIALALTAHSNGNDVTIWSAFEQEVEMLKKERSNPKLLAGIVIPQEIDITGDISRVNGADIVIMAVPSSQMLQRVSKARAEIECLRLSFLACQMQGLYLCLVLLTPKKLQEKSQQQLLPQAVMKRRHFMYKHRSVITTLEFIPTMI